MTVSPREALDWLNKWKNEGVLVTVLSDAAGFSFGFTGLIVGGYFSS